MNVMSERVLALAALFQAVSGVHQLARTGQVDSNTLQTAVKSVLTRDAESTEAIFGGVQALLPGLRAFHRLLTQQVPSDDMAVTQYAVAVLHLAKKLQKKPKLMERLADGISKAERSVSHFGQDHENVYASLADTYSETAGQIQPRIMVSGEDSHLQNPRIVNQIRSLLLAAIRSAVLWQQLGGNRFSLIFRRRALAEEALRLSHAT